MRWFGAEMQSAVEEVWLIGLEALFTRARGRFEEGGSEKHSEGERSYTTVVCEGKLAKRTFFILIS